VHRQTVVDILYLLKLRGKEKGRVNGKKCKKKDLSQGVELLQCVVAHCSIFIYY